MMLVWQDTAYLNAHPTLAKVLLWGGTAKGTEAILAVGIPLIALALWLSHRSMTKTLAEMKRKGEDPKP